MRPLTPVAPPHLRPAA